MNTELRLNWKTKQFVDLYDDVPSWSSNFGNLLLENLPNKHINDHLDVACGTGYPTIEISERLNCSSTGLDNWQEAINRAELKAKKIDPDKIKFVYGNANNIPFDNNTLDLITVNLGLNNFEDRNSVLKECYRVIKPNRSICITTNINGTFKEFYSLLSIHLDGDDRSKLSAHQKNRLNRNEVINLFKNNSFKKVTVKEKVFVYKFKDINTFLNSKLIQNGFIDDWTKLLGETTWKKSIENIHLLFEKSKKDSFNVTVPGLYYEGKKT